MMKSPFDDKCARPTNNGRCIKHTTRILAEYILQNKGVPVSVHDCAMSVMESLEQA